MNKAALHFEMLERGVSRCVDEHGHPIPITALPPMRALAKRREIESTEIRLHSPTPRGHSWFLVIALPQLRDDEAQSFQVITLVGDITAGKPIHGCSTKYSHSPALAVGNSTLGATQYTPLVNCIDCSNYRPSQPWKIERVLVADVPDTLEIFHSLKTLGVSLVTDDFGEGYSALNYLRRLPFDGLNSGHHFTHGIPSTPTDTAICEAIIRITQSPGHWSSPRA